MHEVSHSVCVGVIINSNVLSVYSAHGKGGVNAYGTMHTHLHALQNMQLFAECVHVIALCTLHVAFLGYHTINEKDKCTCSTSSTQAHAVYSMQHPTVSCNGECCH